MSVRTLSDYVGAPPSEAVGPPIRIGFLNNDLGGITTRGNVDLAGEAVRLVNAHLGGVKGRPIELKVCQPTDPAQSTQCAQTFAADPSVVAVLQGTVDGDTTGFHATLEPKLPILGALPLAPSDAVAANTYYLGSGQYASFGVVNYAKTYARAKKVSLMSLQGFVGADQATASLAQAMEAVGIKVTTSTFAYTATDLSDAVIASRAAEADLLMPFVVSPQQCVALTEAVQKHAPNTPVLTLAGCMNPEVRKLLGDYPRYHYLTFAVNAEASAADELTAWQVQAFNEWYAPLGPRGFTRESAVQMLQLVLALTKALNGAAGEGVTAASAAAQFRKFTGPVYLGVPRLTYGVVPGLPALGSLASRVYAYLGNETWRDATGGQWLEPPLGGQQQKK